MARNEKLRTVSKNFCFCQWTVFPPGTRQYGSLTLSPLHKQTSPPHEIRYEYQHRQYFHKPREAACFFLAHPIALLIRNRPRARSRRMLQNALEQQGQGNGVCLIIILSFSNWIFCVDKSISPILLIYTNRSGKIFILCN